MFIGKKKKGNTLQTVASQPRGGIALYRDILANILDQSSEDKDTKKCPEEANVQEEKEMSNPTELNTSVAKKGYADRFEMTDEELDAAMEQAKKTLKKASVKGSTPEEMFRSANDNADAILKAQSEVDFWNSVVSEFYKSLFPNNTIATPIGTIKLGENQYTKLESKNRTNQLGNMHSTLTSPDVIIYETPDINKVPKDAEREGSLLFVKTFTDIDGSKYVNFKSVSVRKDGLEVVVSNHIIGRNGLLAKLQDGKIFYTRKPSGVKSERHLINSSESLPDLVPTQPDGFSRNKDK